jgi:hypothetical protein
VTPRPRRNQRPRDGLGRPLPYGTPGVAGQPEGVSRTPAESIAEAQRLLDAGLPFHAHEVLEDAWKSAPADERELWRGLAQLAVGVTHAARGNRAGAIALLERSAVALTGFTESPPHRLDIAGLQQWLGAAIDAANDAATDHVSDPTLPLTAPRLLRSDR